MEIVRYHHLGRTALPDGKNAWAIQGKHIREDNYTNIHDYGPEMNSVLVQKDSFSSSSAEAQFGIAKEVSVNALGPDRALYGLWTDRNKDNVIEPKEVNMLDGFVGAARERFSNIYTTIDFGFSRSGEDLFLREHLGVAADPVK